MRPPREFGTDLEGVTLEQALERARARWPGFSAWAEKCHNPRAPYQVGIMFPENGRPRRKRLGSGLTWNRAFLSADRREQISHVPRRSRLKRRRSKEPVHEQMDLITAQGCADEMVRG